MCVGAPRLTSSDVDCTSKEDVDKMISRQKIMAPFLAALMFALMPLTVSAAARPTSFAPIAAVVAQAGGVTVPVAGTTSKGGKFNGAFAIREFRVVGDRIVAVGTLTGTIQNGVGAVIGTVLRTVQMLVTIGDASCDILHLELGDRKSTRLNSSH